VQEVTVNAAILDPQPASADSIDPLREIERRVLWLSTAIIHHANRVRPNPSGLKVGGHQASSTSIVSIMTSLWFEQLESGDRVSVKPHASPVLHAINYLLDQLDEKYMTTLRELGGLQSYPSRAKDPDPVDYSTGSVGIGATAPIWGAFARRYVNATIADTGRGRQYSLVGDAELDEGAIWEAVLDSSVSELGEIVWIVDLNRQSLDRVVPNIAAGKLCAQAADRLRRDEYAYTPPPLVPTDMGRTPSGTATTQTALGRALLDLTREAPEAAKRVVTVSPDVSSSTNLAGWLNKVGVWSPNERQNWFADDAETIMHWRERPTGQHMELGIAEVNLVGLMGELGATWSRWGQPLFPIGVLYDPFVERALEPWSYGIYAGGQSILVGTPAGVTLATEGGAHQSIKTPSIGLEQPGCISYEPAFAIEVEWTLFDGIARLGRPDGSSSYLRLSTRPVDQTLAAVPTDPAARERRRRQVIAGAYTLRRSAGRPAVTLVGMGAMITETLQAADRLAEHGTDADVVCVTSPGLLFEGVRARGGLTDAPSWILEQVLPAERAAPMVTVLDGHPHTLAFLSTINRVPSAALGVSRFGQAGGLDDVYRYHGIDTDSIVRAALDLTA
jgi:pyruvate dehydrogenase complex dehydrogenase (E1) component